MTALTVDELKTELRSLSQRRAALEAEIAARTARLEAAPRRGAGGGDTWPVLI